MRLVKFIKATVLLIVGVSVLVIGVSGHALQATYHGWTAVPVSGLPRLMAGVMGITLTSLGVLLVYKRQ